ncbi:MAG: anaerobic sulfatase maturase [Phycisphaerales bacterium]|nr:MAG: anaerobic sulfatase maturase [Phycisphaerales bacterium]
MQPFTLLIKPSGSECNVDCVYCFYKCRAPEVGRGRQRMSEQVLEKLVKDYMQLRFALAGFAWQGGEPTLMGLDFFKKAVELQKKYGVSGQEVGNSLQTNAILLNEKWCRFLHESKFLVGVSIDGPKEFHDYYRLDHSGGGTFDRVLRAIENCKQYDVEFNTLTLINARNVAHPEEVFDFLMELGVRYLQFIPCVELNQETGRIADFSITPEQYGEFLCRLFDRWYDHGPRKVSIRDFDSIVSYYVTGRHTICTFDKQCSQYIVIEHTGDAFCCDFFVEPKWRLGNIFETPIEKLAASNVKKAFARAKKNLCDKCLLCRHLAICRGGCMKDRAPFEKDSFGKESYFCEAYKRFFDYATPRFMQLAAEVNAESANPSATGRS